MIDQRKVKNRVIFTLLVVIVIMVTGIIVLASNNKYGISHESGSRDPRWKVEFTSIAEGEKTGKATSRYKPYYVGTYASFYVDFVAPGDSIVYDIQVSNLGNIDAELEDIIYVTNPYKDAIKYELIGIREGEELKAGRSKNFKIKVSYDLHSNVAVKFDKPISIVFNYEQD